MKKFNIETKVQIEPIEVFVRDRKFVTYNCPMWGNSICKKISIDDDLADIAKELPDGKFKIEIIVTQLSDND